MGQDQRRDPGSRNRSGALSESVAGGKAAEGEGGDVDVAVDRCFVRGGGYDSTKKREKRRTKSPSRSQTPLPLVMAEEEQKEENPFPPVITLKVISLLWGDLTGSVEKWVALVRKRSGGFPPSGFPHRHPKGETMPDACPMTNRQRRYRLIVR
ncbi:hypothetical protein B296_00026727 [Ensete ventricosum]|uniref:Uncharacterized protein n=1 Tax=Ensete ventricosum TaxID=4639 RepID=A0A426YR80_ENSVE|nr:hypothetical protein B296_00026727 [Ensete ventricosum]